VSRIWNSAKGNPKSEMTHCMYIRALIRDDERVNLRKQPDLQPYLYLINSHNTDCYYADANTAIQITLTP